MSVPALSFFLSFFRALGYLPVTGRKRGERSRSDRFTAKLGWSCGSSKAQGNHTDFSILEKIEKTKCEI